MSLPGKLSDYKPGGSSELEADIKGRRKLLGHDINLDKVTGRIIIFRKAGHIIVVEVRK